MRDTILGSLLAVAVLVIAGAAFGLINPHVKPEPCESCHTKIPTKEDGRHGDYYLLKDTIDGTCEVCHERTCCAVGTLHGAQHPTNVNRWDFSKFRRPKTLPLFNGYITCSTCHFHSKQDGPDYKLVRIVKVSGGKGDSSDLCTDCHEGY